MRGVVFSLALVSCASTLPEPQHSAHKTEELVEVPSRPPSLRVEMVPAQPDPRAVWVDGGWNWTGRRWSWTRGGWVIPPEGATFAPWVVVLSADARVWFAPGTWKNAKGAPIDAPTAIVNANERRGPR
jgi:hypothetical protein